MPPALCIGQRLEAEAASKGDRGNRRASGRSAVIRPASLNFEILWREPTSYCIASELGYSATRK